MSGNIYEMLYFLAILESVGHILSEYVLLFQYEFYVIVKHLKSK